MRTVNAPADTAAKLKALKRSGILDVVPEAGLDDLTKLASHSCGTRIALIWLTNGDRAWIPSIVGWDAPETFLETALCVYPFNLESLLIVSNAAEDERFAADSVVTEAPHIRFCAGVPMVMSDGLAIGTLCIFDQEPRQLESSQIETLQLLSRQITTQLELRANVINLERTVTRQKRVEQTLSQRNQRFRHTLHELKQTQSQLIQTEKMSSLGQMVAGVAHEINNPVSFVYGNLTYVNRYIQDLFSLLNLYQQHYPEPHPAIQHCIEAIDLDFLYEDLPKILSSMKVGADRIRQIVLSLRNFSRLDEAEKKPVDIHQGIDNTLLILQHRLKANVNGPGIDVIKHYGNVPLVECYAGQLNQVFMNILSNAIDALEQISLPHSSDPELARTNQITIRTEVVEHHAEGQTPSAIIHIKDNGPGIPEDARERIFDPFFTTKPVGKGTGLGLAISYQIVVERHGGTLDCYSKPGEGTEFYIEIPIRQPQKPVLDESDVLEVEAI
jgi:two-component system, NtrC family, sensor kinase